VFAGWPILSAGFAESDEGHAGVGRADAVAPDDGERDLMLVLDGHFELDHFDWTPLEPNSELLATPPNPGDGERPREFIVGALPIRDGDTVLTLLAYVVMPGGSRQMGVNDPERLPTRLARIDEILAAVPGESLISVWATYGDGSPAAVLMRCLLTLADAQGIVDRWLTFQLRPVGHSHEVGRALVAVSPIPDAPPWPLSEFGQSVESPEADDASGFSTRCEQ
jgi:hypothetical protein